LRRHRASLLAVTALAALAACDARPEPAADLRAGPETGSARRVISLVPSVTDLIVALDASDRLIARTDYDEHPVLDTLPSAGEGLTPNVEWLVAQQPDLVIAWPDEQGRGVVARLERLGVPVMPVRLESVAEVAAVTRRLGHALGLAGRARALADSITAGLDSVAASVRGLPRPSVLYVVGVDAPWAAAPGSFMHELIVIAGGSNAAPADGPAWVQLSLEEVVRRAPDFVFTPAHGDGDAAVRALAGAPGWRELEAARQGRVVAVDGALFDRPGPRLPEAAARLADVLHPERP